ncbi:MAG: multidrug effflux MFS transporter [Alphaproteobacteria bacterium]
MMRQRWRVLVLHLLAVGLTLFATDVYSPSMPLMADVFTTSSDVVQLTISFYMLAIAFTALFYGPISDSIGRRKTYLLGFCFFFVGSLLCIWADTIWLLIAGRFVQGMGAGVASPVGGAMIKDSFRGKEATRVFSMVSGVIVIAPGIAPIIGGYLAKWYGWEINFVLIAVLSVVLIAFIALVFQETHTEEHRHKFHTGQMLKNMRTFLKNPLFVGYVIVIAGIFSSLWCFLTVAPFVYIETFGVPMEFFGYYMAAIIVTHMITASISQRVVMIYDEQVLIRFGMVTATAGGFFMLLLAYSKVHSPIMFTATMMVFISALSSSVTTSVSKAIDCTQKLRGTAASVIAFFRMGSSAFGSFYAAYVQDVNFMPVAGYLIVGGIISHCGYYFLVKPRLES